MREVLGKDMMRREILVWRSRLFSIAVFHALRTNEEQENTFRIQTCSLKLRSMR